MYNYSYKYNNRKLSEAEIYQQAVDQDEAQGVVNFYRYVDSDEIITCCAKCTQEDETELEYIDKAGDWDICLFCGCQNIPQGYSLNNLYL